MALIALFDAQSLSSQIPTVAFPITSTQQVPRSVHWQRMVTPNFEVIFPADFVAEAKRVAATLERLHGPLGASLGRSAQRVTVVLQTQAVYANAYVAHAPRRSVWYTTPPDYDYLAGSVDWLTELATHEMRHVAQYDAFLTGTARGLKFLGGDYFGYDAFIPSWLWEGDAVAMETALTRGGRGRMPEFDREIRALALADQLPRYRQAINGSYAHVSLSPYPVGYIMTTYLRNTFGPDIIGSIFRTSGWVLSPEISVPMKTRLTLSRVYDSAMASRTRDWRAQIDGIRITNAQAVTKKPRVWTNYHYPQYASDGSFIAIKSGLDDAPHLIRVDSTGAEEKLTRISTSGGISAVGNKVVWAEQSPDARWGLRGFSEIHSFDLNTRQHSTLTHNTRFFRPVLSPDMRFIAAVEHSTTYRSSLVILDAATGIEQNRYSTPPGTLLMDPSWSNDGNNIALTRVDESGKDVIAINARDGSIRILLQAGPEDITRPIMYDTKLFFGSGVSGIDNIYSLDLGTGAVHQVTSREVGAYDEALSPDGRFLVFSDYTVNGHRLAVMPIDSTGWLPWSPELSRPLPDAAHLSAQEGGVALDTVPLDTTAVYHTGAIGLHGLVNLHSWNPVLRLDPVDVGVTLYSTNVLNTLAVSGGFDYNKNEKTNALDASVSYAGLYPIIDVGVERRQRASSIAGTDGRLQFYGWTERSMLTAVRLPLDFSHGPAIRSLSLAVKLARTRVSDVRGDDPFTAARGQIAPVTYAIDFLNAWRTAPRDIQSELQWLTAKYTHTPFRGDYDGAVTGVYGGVHLPGAFQHHGVRLRAGFEKQTGEYHFYSAIPSARGFNFEYRNNISLLRSEYRFPIAYPDFDVGPLLYVRRLRANVFYDYGVAYGGGPRRVTQSTGVEFIADINRLTAENGAVGIRYAYRAGKGGVVQFFADFAQ